MFISAELGVVDHAMVSVLNNDEAVNRDLFQWATNNRSAPVADSWQAMKPDVTTSWQISSRYGRDGIGKWSQRKECATCQDIVVDDFIILNEKFMCGAYHDFR